MPDLQNSLKSLKNPQKPSTLSGSLGLSINVVEVPTRPGFCYVRILGNTSEIIQAYNSTVSLVFDLPVIIQWDGTKYIVIGRDVSRYTSWSSSPYLPNHASSHGLRGGDTTWIPSEQFTPLLVSPSGSSLQISPYDYNWQGVWKSGGGGISSIILPSDPTKQKVLLLYIDGPSASPTFLAGTEAPAGLTIKADLIPYLPSFQTSIGLPLAMIRIPTGTTSYTWDNIYDIRQYFGGTASGSSSTGTSGIGEAPINGLPYSRENASWVVSPTGTNYVLPTASPSVLGGVKIGTRLTMTGDVLSADVQNSSGTSGVGEAPIDGNPYARENAGWVAVTGTNYTLPTASPSVLGGIKVGYGLGINSGVLSIVSGSSILIPGSAPPTVALLHMNGANASTTFTDEAGHTWTVHGSAQLTTSNKVLGSAAGLFATSAYLEGPDLNIYDFGTRDFTIEAFVYPTSLEAYWSIIDARSNGGAVEPYLLGLYNVDGTYELDFVVNGTRITATTTSVPLNTWTHIMVVRSAGVLMLFTGGIKDATTLSYPGVINRSSTTIYFASSCDFNYFAPGNMDEFRITNGIARQTADFTPPSVEYSMESDTRPTYAEGLQYYDTGVHKMYIGGISGWEQVTSI